MRRKTRKALIQVLLFISAFFLVLYITSSPSSSAPSKSFAWTKVRYQSPSTTIPEARGKCPSLSTKSSKPALVISRTSSDDASWLDPLKGKYHQCIYTADAPLNTKSNELQIPENRGHEAMVYLTFIIDNYSNIPNAGVVFIHGSRYAWHNDHISYDNAFLLKELNVENALKEGMGYHNLRCDWSVSTCPNTAKAQGSLEMNMQAVLVPYDTRAVSDAMLPRALAVLFGGNERSVEDVKPGRGDAIRSQCCAQFVVSRENILQHSKEEYVALRQWLLDGSAGKNRKGSGAAPEDDRIAGRILSYVWHILFVKQEVGEEGVDLKRLNKLACPSAEVCYCRLYGKCGLKSCKEGSCPGQYRLPKDLLLPQNWAATHS